MKRRRRVKRALGPAPDPIALRASGEFLGSDGPWSTLMMEIGTPPQFVKMLVSTSLPETLVVDADGCRSEDTKDCPTDRGSIFERKNSSSWEDFPNGTTYPLDDDRGIHFRGNGSYGFDVVHITNRLVNADLEMNLPHHIIAQISTKDYFLGMIGINPRPLAPEKRRAGHISNLVDLKNNNLIPSRSYGYTAGAKYKRQGPGSRLAQASLILGGYEPALMKANNVDFKMPPEEAGRDLEVFVRNISYKDSNQTVTQVFNTTFPAVVDSGISHYWLPQPICDAFENAFGLRFNKTLGLYFLSEDQHERMLEVNPEISFTLANQETGGQEIKFALPYSSFELKLTKEYPDNNSWKRYFPVRPSFSPQQNTLGRAFLQEIYLIANYESRNFSLSLRNFDSQMGGGKDHYRVAIPDPLRPPMKDVSNAATYGLIAGGCFLAGLLILVLVWRCGKRRSGAKKDLESTSTSVAAKATELDSNSRTLFEMDKANEVYEMSGTARVEAINPELKCPFDDDADAVAALGPFELPAAEDPPQAYGEGASSSAGSAGLTRMASDLSSMSSGPGRSGGSNTDDELISPIDGTIGSLYTVSTYNTHISPVTPIEPPEQPLPLRPPNPTLPSIKEKT